jgi:hypothetical protein
MKNSTKILIGVVIAIAFLIGFFVGNAVKFTGADKSELAGTMGKMKNSEKFKISENDNQLRSELLSKEVLLKDCQNYYSYFSSSCMKLCDDLDFSIQAAEKEPLFIKDHSAEIEKIKQFRQKLEQDNKDLQLAYSTLTKLSEVDETSLAQVIKSANSAVAQVNYKQNDILAFVNSVEKFFLGNNPYLFPELIKAHDLLSVNQLIPAV